MKQSKPYIFPLAAFLLTVLLALRLENYALMGIVPLVALFVVGLEKTEWIFQLLLFSIPLSTEIQLTSSLGTDFPDEGLMWLCTPLVLLVLIRDREKRRTLLQSGLFLLLILSLCWTAITVFTSANRLLSLKFFLAKVWYVVPMVGGSMLYLSSEASLVRAARILLASLLITVIVILYHHAGWGFSFEGVNYITAPFYRNHVNYGALLVCMIPVAFGLSRTTGGVWTYILGILLVALYFTYSRGAWMALVLAIVAVWLMRRKWLMWAFVLFSVGITTAAIWLVKDNNYLRYRPSFERTIYHGDLNDHLIATYALRDLSTVERFYRWIAASRMVSGHWITGYGPNTFYPTYMTYTVSEYRTYVSDNPEHSTVHNYFLLLLVEQGLPGMLLFYFLYLLMLWEAQRFYHRTEHSFRKGVSMIIVAILTMVGVLNLLSDLIETDKVGTIFYCCTGVLIALRASETITVSHQAHREERSPID